MLGVCSGWFVDLFGVKCWGTLQKKTCLSRNHSWVARSWYTLSELFPFGKENFPVDKDRPCGVRFSTRLLKSIKPSRSTLESLPPFILWHLWKTSRNHSRYPQRKLERTRFSRRIFVFLNTQRTVDQTDIFWGSHQFSDIPQMAMDQNPISLFKGLH